MFTRAPEVCPACGSLVPASPSPSHCVRCALALALRPGSAVVAPSAESPVPLRRFGNYELLEEIARGGMGVVWRARHVSLNRVVAVKLLLDGYFASEAAIRRFEFEAEAAASLDHVNIVPIYEVGQHDGWPFIAMKLIDGPNLADAVCESSSRHKEAQIDQALARVQESRQADDGRTASDQSLLTSAATGSSVRTTELPLDPRSTVLLLAKISRAVHFAHSRGILHRDLKPSNILIDKAGEPHITDFGVARFISADGWLTQTGAILGSPCYMAPEQAAGGTGKLTVAADIYSLGVILYELLTGRLPFKAETPVTTLRLALETEPPPPRSINGAIDRDLETICLKCLAKDPAGRYESAGTFAADLDHWLNHEPILARPAGPIERVCKWCRREPVKAIGSLFLLFCLFSARPAYIAFQNRVAQVATEHPILSADAYGIFYLPLDGSFHEDRCTDNFKRFLFESERKLRIEFVNFPPEATNYRVLIRADQVGRPDPARTSPLTNGQVFLLQVKSHLDRDFYVAGVGWTAEQITKQAPHAAIRLQFWPPHDKRWTY